MDNLDNVRRFYDETVNYEWRRLDRHQVEFELSKRYINRYIKPYERVLDLGGGPGKYALYLSQRGCQVTLADLSQKNIDFAMNKAQELGLPLNALQIGLLRFNSDRRWTVRPCAMHGPDVSFAEGTGQGHNHK